ncbi:protein transport protein YIF1 [Nematocida sp. AWRm77]|nr:protein transport protein YIF1 [Nematocida sp. AWRm77]
MNHGISLGIQEQAFQLGSAYINKTVSIRRFEKLRKYFQIDNMYLIKKLFLLAYPYKGSLWTLHTQRNASLVSIAEPDLYIPFMAVITYILFLAGELEIQNKFRPETLGKISTQTVMMYLLEVFLIKGLSFFFEAKDMELLDAVSFLGYKYVYILAMKMSAIVLSNVLRKLLSVFLIFSSVMFLGKSLKYFLITNDVVIDIKKKRMYFLFIAVIIDLLAILILK